MFSRRWQSNLSDGAGRRNMETQPSITKMELLWTRVCPLKCDYCNKEILSDTNKYNIFNRINEENM